MVAIGVNNDGCREVAGAAEDFTESTECRQDFLSCLKGQGQSGVRMFTDSKTTAMTPAIAEVFPHEAYHRALIP